MGEPGNKAIYSFAEVFCSGGGGGGGGGELLGDWNRMPKFEARYFLCKSKFQNCHCLKLNTAGNDSVSGWSEQ